MASYGFSLQEYLKQYKPEKIDDILTFVLRDRQLFFKNLILSSIEEKQNFALEVEIIGIIQKHLAKKKKPPIFFETKPNIQFNIQRILITRYREHYVIKLKVDRWLGDIIDHVCEYVDQIYDIDVNNLECTYRNSECYRE